MITLIGLGFGDIDSLSRGAERALREASQHHQSNTGTLLLRTEKHPVVESLMEWNLCFETCDELYESAVDFETLYTSIADRVISHAKDGRPIGFAVPGHPLFAEESVRQILLRAEQQAIPTKIVGSGSFVEASFEAAGVSLSVGEGFDVRDALHLTPTDRVGRRGEAMHNRLDPTRSLFIYHVHDPAAAVQVKLALMREYPDDWQITILRQAGVAGQQVVRRIPILLLDREPVDHLTSIYVPPMSPNLRRATLSELAGVMARLRAADGCPWDREQTPQSLKRFLLEETYEVLEAVDEDDPELLCEELGDLMLQVVFYSQLASEEGVFTIDDVLQAIVTKLIRRHPHVFGDINVEDSDEVLVNWERIKREEKTEKDADWRKSALDGVPRAMPALMKAMEISKKAAKTGFEWENFGDVWAKLDEEVLELKNELRRGTIDRQKLIGELGDVLFAVVQVARWHKIDAEDALRTMLQRFEHRFRHIEFRAAESGRNLQELSLAEMDSYWDEAKKLTKEG